MNEAMKTLLASRTPSVVIIIHNSFIASIYHRQLIPRVNDKEGKRESNVQYRCFQKVTRQELKY